MEDRQKHPSARPGDQHEAIPGSYILSQRIRMVGWREHEVLLAERRYRCPHCRRTDMTEMYPAGAPRR
ncbi:MAG: hypothetical protein JW955_20590 [Sedimentisphaerales bacterium]|nr:hypothetical protein [Sedimentisphaerales bacterium]